MNVLQSWLFPPNLSQLARKWLFGYCITFLAAVTKLDKSNFKKEGLCYFSCPVQRYILSLKRSPGNRDFLSHCIHLERQMRCSAPFLLFSFVFSPELQPIKRCRPHLNWVSPPQLTANLETSSQTRPDVCFHGDSKSHQVDSQCEPPQMPS